MKTLKNIGLFLLITAVVTFASFASKKIASYPKSTIVYHLVK